MKYNDFGHEESYCLDIVPGHGDHDAKIIRTRAFMLNNQTEWGYLGAMREPYNQEACLMQGVYDNPHWSDPIYFAC